MVQLLQLLSRAICGAVKSTSFLPIHFYSLAISCFSSSTSKSSLFNCSKCQAVAYCSADHQVNMGKKNKGRRRQVKSETQKKAKGGPPRHNSHSLFQIEDREEHGKSCDLLRTALQDHVVEMTNGRHFADNFAPKVKRYIRSVGRGWFRRF